MPTPVRKVIDGLAEAPVPDAMLESTLGGLSVPAAANDLDGFIIWQNDAGRSLFGDVRGVHYTDLVPPGELAGIKERWAAVTIGGATTRQTSLYKGAEGAILRLEVIAAPLRRNGRIVGVFGISIPWDDVPDEQVKIELSPRQRDVLRLLVRARSTNQIAEELHLAPETVRNYIAGLLKALGARSRLEAALIALRHGLVSLDLD